MPSQCMRNPRGRGGRGPQGQNCAQQQAREFVDTCYFVVPFET